MSDVPNFEILHHNTIANLPYNATEKKILKCVQFGILEKSYFFEQKLVFSKTGKVGKLAVECVLKHIFFSKKSFFLAQLRLRKNRIISKT